MKEYLNPYHDPNNQYSRPSFNSEHYRLPVVEENYKGFAIYERTSTEFHAVKDGVVWYMCAGLRGLKDHIDQKIRDGLDDRTNALIQAAIEKAKPKGRLP